MNRRHVLAGSMLGLISRGGINRSAAAHRRQAADWTLALPDSITFERVTAPTADDLARVAMLASVTRNTWGPDANLSGVCFDFATGGPEFVIVEDGLLRVSVFDPQAPVTDAPDPPAQPTAFLAGDDHAPAPAPPSTQRELRPGDAIEFPDGSKCGKYGDEQDTPVVFLEVTFLPGSASEPDTNEDLDMTGELLQSGSAPTRREVRSAHLGGRSPPDRDRRSTGPGRRRNAAGAVCRRRRSGAERGPRGSVGERDVVCRVRRQHGGAAWNGLDPGARESHLRAGNGVRHAVGDKRPVLPPGGIGLWGGRERG